MSYGLGWVMLRVEEGRSADLVSAAARMGLAPDLLDLRHATGRASHEAHVAAMLDRDAR